MDSRYLIKEHRQITNKEMKKCSALFIIREIYIKTMLRYQYILAKMAEIKNLDDANCWQGHGTNRTHITGYQ